MNKIWLRYLSKKMTVKAPDFEPFPKGWCLLPLHELNFDKIVLFPTCSGFRVNTLSLLIFAAEIILHLKGSIVCIIICICIWDGSISRALVETKHILKSTNQTCYWCSSEKSVLESFLQTGLSWWRHSMYFQYRRHTEMFNYIIKLSKLITESAFGGCTYGSLFFEPHFNPPNRTSSFDIFTEQNDWNIFKSKEYF